MNENIGRSNARAGKVLGGIILLTVGALLLLKQLGYFFPGWLFSWPMLLIALGLFIGVRHQFRGFFWAVLLLVGGVFLGDRFFFPGLNLVQYFWPVLIILFGLYMIFGRSRRRHWGPGPEGDCGPTFHQTPPNQPLTDKSESSAVAKADYGAEAATAYYKKKYEDRYTGTNSDDYLDVVAVFGGIKKNLVTKNFKGGEVVSFMGGSEINLTQADFTGRVELEVTQIMGGCKLIVPSDWRVVSEMVAVLGGIEDRRNVQPSGGNPEKVLVIKGTAVMGGLDIRSY